MYARRFHPVSASASTLCTFETAARNHFILYMHISLASLYNVCENGGSL